MLAKSEKHDFLYRQLCVFCGDVDRPYNNWSPQEYLQGFAYRVHSVSFRTTFASAECRVNIYIGDRPIDPNATIVIRTPFEMNAHGIACVASVTDSAGDEIRFELATRTYSLRYEAFPTFGIDDPEDTQEINLVFGNRIDPDFAIIKHDDTIVVPNEFNTAGTPA